MNINLNVVKFLKQYDSDPELRRKVADAEAAYPGSLEIREAVVEDVLIPIAEEMGLGSWIFIPTKGSSRTSAAGTSS